MRRLVIGSPEGGRSLVLRTVVGVEHAEEWLTAEAGTMRLLTSTGVPAPELVAFDATGKYCEYPSLLMTHLPGRTVLGDEGLAERVPLLARQLVEINALRPAEPIRDFVTESTADSAVVPPGADPSVWAAAIEVLRKPPAYEGRFLHRDFQPGNVLFDDGRLTGVVDWAGTCWGPTDLDVAHCSTNLALLHGPEWGLRFADAYQEAGGVLAATAAEQLYWRLRDACALSEELEAIPQPWREAGRSDLTTAVVQRRMHAYVTLLLETFGGGRA
nr:aminoglycoside phosphotransferase family protein [Kribbella sandramycini]